MVRKQLILFLVILSASFFTHTRLEAQSTILLEYAESLRSSGQYSAAITEYKRFAFFHPQHAEVYRALSGLGMCYREEHEYARAIDCLQELLTVAPSDSVYEATQLEIALTYFISGNIDSGVLEVERVLIASPSPQIAQRALFLKYVALVKRYSWNEAHTTFQQYLQVFPDQSGDSVSCAIDQMLGESSRTSLYSESTAQWLSTFVPGLGQLYVGDFKNALNALALNSLLFYWGTDLLVSHKYFDSVIEFSGVFLRYYLGNRYRAAELAREKNEKKQHDQAETILSLSAKLVHDQ